MKKLILCMLAAACICSASFAKAVKRGGAGDLYGPGRAGGNGACAICLPLRREPDGKYERRAKDGGDDVQLRRRCGTGICDVQ